MEIGWDKVCLEREGHASAVVQAGENGGLGLGKKKTGKIGELFQQWRKGVDVDS